MKFTDEQLMLYADGNLDKKTTSQVEKALKEIRGIQLLGTMTAA